MKELHVILDTHDGIGIVDIKDLLPDKEVDKVREQMYKQGANVKRFTVRKRTTIRIFIR